MSVTLQEPVAVVKNGLYQHFKHGDFYHVIGVAKHSETDEDLVVYRQNGKEFKLFVRPLAMFVGTVKHGGKEVPRFRLVD